MQDAVVDDEIAGADRALQQLRELSQALQARLKLRAAHHGTSQHVNTGDSSSSSGTAGEQALSTPHADADEGLALLHREPGEQTPMQQLCTDDAATQSPSAETSSSSSSSHPAAQLAAAASAQQTPAWKQHVQQEQQLLQAQRTAAAAAAAARNRQQQAQQEAASLQASAQQQQLPFQFQQSKVSGGVHHKLQKTLSTILRDAAARQQAQAVLASPVPIEQLTAPELTSATQPVLVPTAAAAAEGRSSTADPLPPHCPKGACSRSNTPGTSTDVLPAYEGGHKRSSSSSTSQSAVRTRGSSSSKQQMWAGADAQTDAEVNSYLLDCWQQHHLATAALVLQCAWRSRAARLSFGRYSSKRRASVVAALQPALLRWRLWARACAHHRRYQQQAALQAWRELLQLQTQLFLKVVQGLQRGALAGNMPTVMMWRMCTSSNQQQATKVRPSLGGMLAAILLQRVPRKRLREALLAWRQLTRSQAVLRAKAHRMLTAVLRSVERQRLQQAVRFWRMYTTCCICERLQLQLPCFPHACGVFDAWLWQHERRQYTQRQAAQLAGRLALVRCFVLWHGHVHKMLVMRAAWSGLQLHTREELLRGGMSAFKATWREELVHRRLVAAAFAGWRQLMDRNKAVASVRKRIRNVNEAGRKLTGLAAFKHFCKRSQLLTAAGVLKLWHARPLALAHIHAWLHDTLHASFYLCWWRWRRRAVARLRLRAFLGLHMYRAHWLSLELALRGWRKVTAAAAAARQQQQQQELLAGQPDSRGIERQQQQQVPQGSSNTEDWSPDPQSGSDAEGCSAADDEEEEEEGPLVAVSLADFAVGHPWRPLLQRTSVLAPQDLRRLSGLRLGRAVKDLRELEGGFVVKDPDSGDGSVWASRVFARPAVSPGLQAMATAQLPMDLLWRMSFPADKFCWQRVVGLMQQQAAHPDSWTALISLQHSSGSHSSSGSQHTSSVGRDLQDFLSPCHSSARYKCTCSRCPHSADVQAAAVTETAVKPAADAAASMARARLRLRAGLRLGALQVPGASPTAASSTATTPVAGTHAAVGDTLVTDGTSSGTASGGSVGTSTSCVGGSSGGGMDSRATSNVVSSSSVWPACWSCEDVAGLCRLVQAEELLETAVHTLLGIGADSSTELYEKLQQMTRGTRLPMQGDMLVWLLSAVLAQGSAHSCAALARARARDELLIATMELRERAVALHLHIPHRFTLNSRRARLDVRASWSAVITRVEQERDWDASSSEDDTDPQQQALAGLLALQPQQQEHWSDGASSSTHMSAVGRPPSRMASTQQPYDPLQLSGLQPAKQQDGSDAAGAQVGPSRLSVGPQGARAAAAVLALAAAAAGPRARASAAQQHMTPGMMLVQSPIPAGLLWPPAQGSRPTTPGPTAAGPQQPGAEQPVASEHLQEGVRQAQQKQQAQQRRAMAAARGLFGNKTNGAGRAAACRPQDSSNPASAIVQDAAGDNTIFTGPDFLPLASLSSPVSGPSSAASRASTHRSRAAAVSDAQPGAPALPAPELPHAPIAHAAAEDSSSTSSTSAADAAAAVGQSQVLAARTPSRAALGSRDAATPVSDAGLKAELETILTELLAPLVPDTATASTGGMSGAARSGSAPGAAAARGPGDGSRPVSGMSGSVLQGALSAAQGLAEACAGWVLQQQGLPPEDGSGSSSDTLCPAQLLSKPHSAPPGRVHRPQSSCSGSRATGEQPASNGAAALQDSSSRRPASASGNLQPAGAAASLLPQSSAQLFGESLGPDSSGSGSDLCNPGGQEASWQALAVQQGLLDPAAAAGWRAGPQTSHQDGAAMVQEQACLLEGQSSAAEDVDQPSSRQLSACSSLPSIPSCVQSSCTPQQLLQLARRPGGAQRCKGTGVESGLPPIAAAAGPAGSSAARTIRHVPLQQQLLQPSDLLLPATRVPMHAQDANVTLELLPQVAAALEALQSRQQHPSSTQQQVLEGMQQALSLLEPAQLQQQVQLLLQAQRWSAAAHKQQEQDAGTVRILPWGGEMQVPECAESGTRPPTPVGPGGLGGAAAVLSGLLTASLSTRVAFWRQVTVQPDTALAGQYARGFQQQQHGFGSSSPLSDQLHQLAWSSILITSKRQKAQEQQQQQQWHKQQQHGGCEEAGPLAELKQKLQAYLTAHMQWRRQQQYAPPLAPAEKWMTLEHAEQALDFITSMTIAVHQQLLRRHLGLPPLAQQRHSSAAFGSSASRDAAIGAAAAQAAQAAADAAQQQAAASINVCGASVDMSKARRIAPTCSLKAPTRVVPVFVVPRPNGQASSSGCAAGWQSRPQPPDRLAFEPLQGWQTVQEQQQAGLPCLVPADPAGQRVPLSQCTAGRWPGSERREPGGPQTLPRDSSLKSSESSWGGGLSTHHK